MASMNDSIPDNNRSSQPQTTNTAGLGQYLNGLQPYGDFHPEPQTSHDGFMWDPNLDPSLFTNSQINSQVYSSGVATHTPDWNQDTIVQAQDPHLTGYGGLQSSFQLSSYDHPPFAAHPPSPQPGHEPRLVPRPSPSPAQYSNANQSLPIGYRDVSFSNQQRFHPEAMVYPHSSTPAPASTFDANTNSAPYFNYESHVVGHPQLQAMELSSDLAGFPEHSQQRHGNSYIDPSFLTTDTMQEQRTQVAQNMTPYRKPENSQTQLGGEQELALLSASLTDQGQPSAISPMPSSLQGGRTYTNPPVNFAGVFVNQKLEKSSEKVRKSRDPNAPKRPRGRPRKDGSQTPLKQGVDVSTSESDLDDLQVVEKPEPVPALLLGPPPETPEDRVIYEIAKAVWSPRNQLATVEKVRQGIAAFGEEVKKQRDTWKVRNEALKQAELANTTAIPSLKHEVAQFRKTIENVAVQAVRLGHPAHVAKLGENPFTMSALQSFLVDRINALDMDGALVNSILKLMACFKTLDEEMLEKTKTSKILTRLTKKAGITVRNLAQSVLDNAAAASKKKATSLASTGGKGSPVSVNDHQKVAIVTSLKRPREVEGGALPATKRAVVPTSIRQASKPLALQNVERRKMEAAAINAKTTGLAANGLLKSTSVATSKPSAAASVPSKPIPSPFSDLRSASKRPGTSNAARAAAANDKPAAAFARPDKNSPPPLTGVKSEDDATPSVKSTFSFMDTLADMNRPKQVEEKKADEILLETDEERQKRLRKEARRKLRVSWAPEAELAQIKLFVHDPEEETGHGDSSMRDVDDVGGEGRMLKLHKGVEDLDDDDEGRAVTDDIGPFHAPVEIDFSAIDEDARALAFERRGGVLKPESTEKEAQDAREENTLMVMYSLPSDVPPTPKEPSTTGDEDDYTPLTSFGEPEETTRQREKAFYERQRAIKSAATPAPDIATLLNSMKQNQQSSGPEATYNAFPAQTQFQQHQQQQQAQGVDISKILAVMSQLQQAPQSQAPQNLQPLAGQLNVAALLAQVQGQQPSVNPSQGVYGSYGYNDAGNSTLYPGGSAENNDYSGSNKHSRPDPSSNGGEYDDYAWKRRKAATSNSGGASAVKPHPKAKTVICKFWQEGKCKKGDDCTFIHD